MYKKYFVVLAIGAFILNKKNRLLIVKKSPYEKIDASLWTVPGGKVNKNEGIIQALLREVKEETGLDVASYEWINEDVFLNQNNYFHAQHFLCRVKQTKKIILERTLLDYRWISRKDINRYRFPVNIKKEVKNILNK